MYGSIAALDGISIAIRCPTAAQSADAGNYLNRIGFYAIKPWSVLLTGSLSYQRNTLVPTMIQQRSPRPLCTITSLRPNGTVVCVLGLHRGCRLLYHHSVSFNFCLSSIRITVEQVFGVIFSRWATLWSSLRFSLRMATRIVIFCTTLHTFIINERCSSGETVYFNDIAGADINKRVEGEPEVLPQNCLHSDGEVARHVRQGQKAMRDELAQQFQVLGFRRPAR
jgi:hypothetical protein